MCSSFKTDLRSALLNTCIAMLVGIVASSTLMAAEQGKQPAVGDVAQDFSLSTVEGESVKLSNLTKSGPVVLIVLRGYPGYQCPVCSAQVGQFLASNKKFKDAQASIVLVYPGPAGGLKEHANEFIRGKTLPDNVYLVLDPDYAFTNKYQLRWDAKNETAYPSTFVVDTEGKIRFAKISKTHGGRASVDEVLKTLSAD
jgi:thioredoxin-dependent peroxiredoxin